VLARGKVSQIAEVAYVFCERHQGESKVTSKHVEYLHHLVRLRLASGRMGRFDSHRFPGRSVHPLWFSGLSGVFVDMALLYLLSDPQRLAPDSQ